MEAHLTECVHEALCNFLHRNAVFLAERLYASFANEANAHLLATCYLRSKQPHRAFAVLKGSHAPACRYLFAVACVELALLSDAEQALTAGPGDQVPGGSAGEFLLGVVCRKSNRTEAAVAHFRKALAADPFCWSAFEELCALGDHKEAAALLNNANPDALYPTTAVAAGAQLENSSFVTPDAALDFHRAGPVGTPAAPMASLASPPGIRSAVSHTPRPMDLMEADAPTSLNADAPTPASFVTPSPGAPGAASMPPPAALKLQGAARGVAAASAAADTTDPGRLATPGVRQRRKPADEGKLRKVTGRLFTDVPAQSLRRSSRLSGLPTGPLESTPTPGPRGRGAAFGTGYSTRGQHLDETMQRGWDSPSAKTSEGGREALALLRLLGEGHRRLSNFQCQEALAAFSQLPPAQYNTGWVLCQVGRAHAEAVNYLAAERAFAAARRACPHQLEGLEHYSTVLWHLKRDAQLAHLAHEAVGLDRLSPAAWCVLGNCLSLQREHEAALRAFNRAAALDHDFAYAYTLAGHEHLAAEDWDAAVNDYRAALSVDVRHYNAWYGIGAVLMRQEKYDLAEYHFRRALAINSRSSVLHCFLGQAMHALGRPREALPVLDAAIKVDACNPLARFERASVLLTMDRPHEALAELNALREIEPREGSVYVLLAKVHRRLNQPGPAALCAGTGTDMGTATELEGKAEDESVHDG